MGVAVGSEVEGVLGVNSVMLITVEPYSNRIGRPVDLFMYTVMSSFAVV